MSRDYSNYRSYYQPEPPRHYYPDPPRYYYPESNPRPRRVQPPPPPPPREPINPSFRQTQQFWRNREDVPPVVPERHSHRRYRLEEPRRDRNQERERERERDRRSSEVPANVSRHRSVVTADTFDPAAFLFANLFQFVRSVVFVCSTVAS